MLKDTKEGIIEVIQAVLPITLVVILLQVFLISMPWVLLPVF